MGSVRQWVVLPVLLLLAAAMAVVAGPRAGASTVPASVSPVQMNYGCALKANGQLKYVATPSECDATGKKAGSTGRSSWSRRCATARRPGTRPR